MILLLASASAAAADTADDRAMALLQDGKRQEALAAFEAIIAARPANPVAALFFAGRIDIEDGNWRAAMPLLQRLVKLRPGSFPAWELMIQTYQAAGETENRDRAIQSLYDAWHSALDPATQTRISFTRDRIAGPNHTVVAVETLEPGGDDIVQFLFQPVDNDGPAAHLILLRSDTTTNARWRENGLVPQDTIVFHLDTIEQLPDGRTSDRSYAFYLRPPGYDDVRAKVVQILSGAIQPLNGDPDPFWSGGVRPGAP